MIILSDEQELFDEAESFAHDALEHLSHESELYFHLGNIHGKRGKFETAEEFYLKALSLGATTAYYGNLGVLYHRWKKISKAKEAYEAALILDPNNMSARRNLDSLK